MVPMVQMYFIVVVTSSLLIWFILRAFTGVSVYPTWLIEAHLAFYWFYIVLQSLVDFFRTGGRLLASGFEKRTYHENLWFLCDKLFFAHLISTIAMRLSGIHFLIAYPGSLVVTVLIPLPIALKLYKRWQVVKESERIPAKILVDIARSHNEINAFLENYPDSTAYVADFAKKNQQATCYFVARRDRPEREDLAEDLIAVVSVDMKQRRITEAGVQYIRYLFYEYEDGVAVHHLPEPSPEHPERFDAPPDDFTLDKIDSAGPRHPTLKYAPLPIVTHNSAFERISDESTPLPT